MGGYRATIVGLSLALLGSVLILVGNSFEGQFQKVDVDALIANIGALFLVTGVFQWVFEAYVRVEFAVALRDQIIGQKRVSDSGISDFHSDSKDVDFSDLFTSSQKAIIGVNYSAKLIDNSIDLLKRRSARGLHTTIIVVDPESASGSFLVNDFSGVDIKSPIEKIIDIMREIEAVYPNNIKLYFVNTILRYSFIQFDSRIWVVVGTSGKGRRAVPGFFTSHGSPWHTHFDEDISKLLESGTMKNVS